MKTTTKTPAKLTLSKETLCALTVRSAIRAGNDGPSVNCSNQRECPKPLPTPAPVPLPFLPFI